MQATLCKAIYLLVTLCYLVACGRSNATDQPLTPGSNPAMSATADLATSTGVDIQLPQPTQMLGATIIVDYAAATLGVVVDQKMQIIDIEQGSAAERAGLQRGDRLTTIDGLSLPEHLAEAKTMLYEQGSQHNIELTRNGVKVSITATLTYPVPQGATATPVFAPNDYF